MDWSLTPHIFIYLTTIVVSCTMALYTWRQRYPVVGLQPFMFGIIGAVIWVFATAMQTVAIDLSTKLFWVNVQFIGVATIPTLWLAFILKYSGQDKRLPPNYQRYLSIIPLFVIIMAWTNNSHHLLIIEAQLHTINGNISLQIQPGPLQWLYALYAYLLLMISSSMLLQIIREKSGLYRQQAIALLIASLLPWFASLLDILAGERAATFTLSALAFFLSNLVLIGAFYYLQLLNIVPVAQETVIENMSDGVIVIDNAGRIADINPAAAHILNKPIGPLIGESVSQAFSDQDSLIRNYNESTAHRSEIVRQTGGKIHYYEMKISDLWSGKVKLDGQLIVLHDVTERKNTAKALTQAKINAETASQIKDEFLANMSHELRTPLNSIIGYTDLTLMGTYGELNDQQQDRLETVSANARHLLQLINDILDISRIESDQLLLHPEQVDLKRILHDCIATMQPAVHDKPVELALEIPEELPEIMTDPRRFKQILINLITNAIKFTPAGSITLKAQILNELNTPTIPAQHIPAHTTAPWAFLQVIDTGIGIAPEDQPLVFEDFRQVDGSSTRKYQGSGVGLTITRRLVTKMHGTIWVESATDSGSTMNILLPANEQHNNGHHTPEHTPVIEQLTPPS